MIIVFGIMLVISSINLLDSNNKYRKIIFSVLMGLIFSILISYFQGHPSNNVLQVIVTFAFMLITIATIAFKKTEQWINVINFIGSLVALNALITLL